MLDRISIKERQLLDGMVQRADRIRELEEALRLIADLEVYDDDYRARMHRMARIAHSALRD